MWWSNDSFSLDNQRRDAVQNLSHLSRLFILLLFLGYRRHMLPLCTCCPFNFGHGLCFQRFGGWRRWPGSVLALMRQVWLMTRLVMIMAPDVLIGRRGRSWE